MYSEDVIRLLLGRYVEPARDRSLWATFQAGEYPFWGLVTGGALLRRLLGANPVAALILSLYGYTNLQRPVLKHGPRSSTYVQVKRALKTPEA